MDQQRATTVTVLSGTAVIAVAYGLGRYAYGLFVPQLTAALDLSVTASGTIGGLSHVGYALGLVGAPAVVRRLGPGRTAAVAALTATVGLAAVSTSTGAAALGAAILVSGVASGLASPALAELVVRRLSPAERSPGQTWINSGTSLGLAVSAPPLLLAVHWRGVWAAFALVAAVVTVVAWRTLTGDGRRSGPPRTSDASDAPDVAPDAGGRCALLAYAGVLGATSAAYWTFARQQVLENGTSEAWSVAFWVAIGAFGLLGGTAGGTAARRGWRPTSRWWSLAWAGSLAALAVPGLPTSAAVASAAGFGAAYMALTGLTILWAAPRDGDGAASGVRAAFLALGVGQAVATPLAGFVADARGLTAAFAASAVGSLTLLALRPPTVDASGRFRERGSTPTGPPSTVPTRPDEEPPCHRTRRSTTSR